VTWRLGRLRIKGTKTWCKLTADCDRELQDAARRLREPIKPPEGYNGEHLDLTPHKRNLALRWGAREDD
jgi:hypothetical protein